MQLRLLTLCAVSTISLFLAACESSSDTAKKSADEKVRTSELTETKDSKKAVSDNASKAQSDPAKEQGNAGKSSEDESKTASDKKKDSPYETIEWLDLMPEDDLDVLLNPPEYINEIVEGSEDDQISNQVQSAITAASDDRYQQALVSTRVVKKMDGALIRIPGFIVPLEFSSEQVTTEFFLVPFFGACIHAPPPPPNQIIFVSYPKGVKLGSLYTPFWLSGKLKASLVENDMATAAYTLELEHVTEFTDEDYE